MNDPRPMLRYVTALLVATLCLAWVDVAAREVKSTAKIGEVWWSNPQAAELYREAFHSGLRDLGYRDGSNVTLLVRYAGGDEKRIPELVQELIAAKVDVMFLIPPAIPVARQMTQTIPIVCAGFFDPVAEGIVTSLARPGGNITGLSWQSPESSGKRMELATQIVPGLKRAVMIFAKGEQGSVLDANSAEKAAQRLGVSLRLLPVHDLREIDEALSEVLRERPQLLIVGDSSVTTTNRQRLTTFATKARLPLISEGRVWAEAGAVLAYGPNAKDMFRRAATYVDRILKGAHPGELPIEQPRRFELILNLSTAEAIGLKIPELVFIRADEMIR